MLEKELEWLENYFKWQEQRRPALFSLMKSMLLEVLDMMMEMIMMYKEQCLKLLINWMVLIQEEISRF